MALALSALLPSCGDLRPPIGGTGVTQQSSSQHASSGYEVLHSFGSHLGDGRRSYAPLIDVNGTLYGTTYRGGAHGIGTVFSITATGKERTLHSFAFGSDGAGPQAGLIDVNGALYGTTTLGGSYGNGTVFRITARGAERVIYSFRGGSADGGTPVAGLIDVRGTLYGTTFYGGANLYGTVFSVTTGGSEKVVYSFGAGSTDGENPTSGLIDFNGRLYGTTPVGGASGNGTVFGITTTGRKELSYSFGGGSDGANPQGVIDSNDALYGTTAAGGSCVNRNYGCGTVFKITTAGIEKVLYSFGGSPDGEDPAAGLVDVRGTLYGTTMFGGSGDGTIFDVTTAGKEKIMHLFDSTHGALPAASLIDAHDTLYGTTTYGGGHGCRTYDGCGTVFALTR